MVTKMDPGDQPQAADAAPRLFANVSGEGDPVILLHGLFGMGSNLGGLARHLAPQFEVHQLDLPNHGRSEWAGATSLRDMADAIAAYARELSGPVCVVGHSLGGKVAMQMALDHSDLVQALVVADIAPVAYPSTHDKVFAAIADVASREPSSRGEAAALMGNWIEEDGVIQFLSLSLKRDGDGTYRWRFNADALRESYAAIREAPVGDAFANPALFIYGELSNYVNADGIAAANGMFGAAEFEVIEGTGHWLHAEKPALFNAAVGAFLNPAAAGGSA